MIHLYAAVLTDWLILLKTKKTCCKYVCHQNVKHFHKLCSGCQVHTQKPWEVHLPGYILLFCYFPSFVRCNIVASMCWTLSLYSYSIMSQSRQICGIECNTVVPTTCCFLLPNTQFHTLSSHHHHPPPTFPFLHATASFALLTHLTPSCHLSPPSPPSCSSTSRFLPPLSPSPPLSLSPCSSGISHHTYSFLSHQNYLPPSTSVAKSKSRAGVKLVRWHRVAPKCLRWHAWPKPGTQRTHSCINSSRVKMQAMWPSPGVLTRSPWKVINNDNDDRVNTLATLDTWLCGCVFMWLCDIGAWERWQSPQAKITVLQHWKQACTHIMMLACRVGWVTITRYCTQGCPGGLVFYGACNCDVSGLNPDVDLLPCLARWWQWVELAFQSEITLRFN